MTAFYNEYKTENNKVILPRLRNVIRRRETISLRKKVEKVYQAQKALIKENAAWDFIDMYEKDRRKRKSL